MFDYIAWIRFGTSAGLPLKILVTRARMRRAAWIRADSKLVALVVLPLVISGCGTRIFNSGQATKSASPPSSTPTLSINSSSVTYGDVRVDTAATQSLTLSSTGTAAVTVTAATVSGPGFSLEASSLPFTLNPGDTANLAVKFDPSDAGPASGQLTLSSNSSTGGWLPSSSAAREPSRLWS